MKKNGVNQDDVLDLSCVVNSFDVAEENVKAVNSLLKNNQNRYFPKYVIMYHGTGKSLSQNIHEKGLLPTSHARRRSFQSTNGYVCLAHSFERAKIFGDLGNSGQSDVYAVLLKTTELKADMDQLRNKRLVEPERKIGNSVGDSLVFGGGVRVKGVIPNYRFVKLPDYFECETKRSGPFFKKPLFEQIEKAESEKNVRGNVEGIGVRGFVRR